MKKLLLTIAIMLLSLHGWASTKIEDLYYNLDDWKNTAEVTYEIFWDNNNYRFLTGALTIPEAIVYNGKTYSVTSIGDYAFYICSGLTSVEIPNSVTSIGNGAFDYCNGLTSVTIGNSVTSIGDYAFAWCSSLASVEIPNSVTSIGDAAFGGCTELKSIVIDNGNPAFASIDGILYNKNLDTIICFPPGLTGGFDIPNSVTSIGGGAFYGCSGLISVTIPNSVTSIGVFAFWGCPIETLNIDCHTIGGWFSQMTTLKKLTIGNSVTSIGNSAFEDCPIETLNIDFSTIGSWFSGKTTLKELTIGNSVTSIGNFAFSGCSGLTGELIIPDSVTSIGDAAFYGCSGLTSVTIGNSVTSIGYSAFSGCSGLTGDLIIPNSVTSIRDQAFYGCSEFTALYIGEKVKSIGSKAFASSQLLEEIVCASVIPPTGDKDIFSDFTYTYATLFVPERTLNSYKSLAPWSNFFTITTLEMSDVEEVSVEAAEAFYDVFNLNGQIVKRQASQSDIDALSPGIYIINGKKILK